MAEPTDEDRELQRLVCDSFDARAVAAYRERIEQRVRAECRVDADVTQRILRARIAELSSPAHVLAEAERLLRPDQDSEMRVCSVAWHFSGKSGTHYDVTLTTASNLEVDGASLADAYAKLTGKDGGV